MSDEISVNGLWSNDPQVVAATKGQILTQRRTIVKAAVEVLNQARGGKQPQGGDFEFNDPRVVAIQVLAEFRASEAVDELMRIVDLKLPGSIISSEGPPTIGDFFPAAGTLTKIGRPAVRPAVWELTKKTTLRRRENLCWVIGTVEGAKVGRWRIEEQIAELEEQLKQTKVKRLDPRPIGKQMERLRAAIPVLEKLFPAVKKNYPK